MGKLDIGSTILGRRKALGLTQKQVADKLNVTDKAVSKWERGQGYPDITMLNDLADALGLTISELMQGDEPAPAANPQEESSEAAQDEALSNALEYADKLIAQKRGSHIAIARLLITAACVVAIFTCAIVDIAVDGQFSWSWIVFAGVLTGWSVVIPLLPLNRRHTLVAAGCATVMTPILEAVIVWQTTGNADQFWHLALIPTITGVVGMWLIVLLLLFTRIGLVFKLSLLALVGGVLSFIINWSISRAIEEQTYPTVSNYINALAFLLVAALLAIWGEILNRRTPRPE